MKCISGLQKSKSRDYIDLLIPEDNPEFAEFLKDLDRKALQVSVEKSAEWFSKSIPKDRLEDMYRANLRICPDSGKVYMRVTVPKGIDIFNDKKCLVDREDINTNDDIISLFQLLGLKYSKTTFEYVIKAVSLKVTKAQKPKIFRPQKIQLSGYSFLESDDENEVDELGFDDEDLFFEQPTQEEDEQEQDKPEEHTQEEEKNPEQEQDKLEEHTQEEFADEQPKKEDVEIVSEDMKLRQRFNLPDNVDLTELKKALMPKKPDILIEDVKDEDNDNEVYPGDKPLDTDFDNFDLKEVTIGDLHKSDLEQFSEVLEPEEQ